MKKDLPNASWAFIDGLSIDRDKMIDRSMWAINYVICKNSLSNEKLAKELGMSTASIDGYRRGLRLPKIEFLLFLQEKYQLNTEWYLYGRGEPFPDIRSKYPDICGPDLPVQIKSADGGVGEEAPASAEARSAQIEFRISDALAMTARVLESRTSYATALYLNIVHFDRAVSSESIVSKCEEDLRAQGELLAKMQARLDDLESQNKTLTQEIRELKGASGDCPPIALGSEHAARTGTDE